MQEIPIVYSDPKMNSMFDSDEDAEKSDERKQGKNYFLCGPFIQFPLSSYADKYTSHGKMWLC